MTDLGSVERLSHSQGELTPTFRAPRGKGKVIHQMDHLYAADYLAEKLSTCHAGDHETVFGQSLSDHLPIVAEFGEG